MKLLLPKFRAASDKAYAYASPSIEPLVDGAKLVKEMMKEVKKADKKAAKSEFRGFGDDEGGEMMD